MKKILKKHTMAIIGGMLISFIPNFALAIDLPTLKFVDRSKGLVGILVNIINTLLWVGGAITVVCLIYGGIIYVTSAGNPEKAAAGKNAVLYAIIGIAVILVSLLIVGWVKEILETGAT